MNTPSAVSHAVSLLREERARIDRALSALGANGTTQPHVAPVARTVTLRTVESGTLRQRFLKLMRDAQVRGPWRTGEIRRALKCSGPGLAYALAQSLAAREIRRVGRGRYALRSAF